MIWTSLLNLAAIVPKRWSSENPDLVLLDIMLPGKDGMTLCDLRARWEGPIVLLTSLDSDMNHILSLEMGANDTF
jgi:two-component system response regulator RstA